MSPRKYFTSCLSILRNASFSFYSEKSYFFFNLDSDDWNELIVFPETVSDIIGINNLKPIDILFEESEVILEIFNRDRVSRIPPYPYRIVLRKP